MTLNMKYPKWGFTTLNCFSVFEQRRKKNSIKPQYLNAIIIIEIVRTSSEIKISIYRSTIKSFLFMTHNILFSIIIILLDICEISFFIGTNFTLNFDR